MNLRTVAIVIFCAALLALASQPLGKLYVESHIEALTSSRLSLNKFRVHPISGRTSVGDSQWIATKPRISPTLATEHISSPISASHAWSQMSLPSVLHKRLVFPLVVIDGVRFELLQTDLAHVPVIATEVRKDLRIPALESLSGPALTGLEQKLTSSESVIHTCQADLQRMENEVGSIEASLSQSTNPLRGREDAIQARQALIALERSAMAIESRIESLTEQYRANVEAARKAFKEERLVATGTAPTLPLSEADFENSARSYIEGLMQSALNDVRPHLGVAVRLLEEINPDHALVAGRGVDFSFTDSPKPRLVCDLARFRGVTDWENDEIPFSGLVKNFGSTGFEDFERPAFELTFESIDKDSRPDVSLNAVLSPDRNGFLLGGKADLAGPLFSTVVNGDFEADIDLETPMLSLKWLMHQRTWTFDVKLECSQAIVGLRESQNKETNASANPTQAVESFCSNDKTTFIEASVRGTVVDGQFVQQSLKIDCPASKPIAKKLQQVYNEKLTQRQKEFLEITIAAFEKSVAKTLSSLEAESQATSTRLATFQSRLKTCKHDVLAILDPSTDVRFSRAPTETLSR